MRVIYRGVDLLAVQTHYFNWEPVYDDTGTDYLYTKVSGAWRAVVNGIASVVPIEAGRFLNYNFRGPARPSTPTVGTLPRTAPTTFAPPVAPTGEGLSSVNQSPLRAIVLDPAAPLPGNDPTNTHASIRHRLSTPRGKLYIFWGQGMESGSPPPGSSQPPGQGGRFAPLFLESPGPAVGGTGDLPCDCKNGPIPKLLSVVESVGDSLTMMVDFSVETYVNESADNNVLPGGPLLSNRFTQTHEISGDSYTTITTEGTAVFRTDFVYNLPAAPDSQRSILFMPIGPGFTRKVLYVRGRADVTGVDYAYEDTQVSVNFVAGPFVKAASISAVHRQAVFNQPDVWANSPLTVFERVLGIAANKNFATHKDSAKTGRPVPPVAPGRPGARRLRGGPPVPVPPPRPRGPRP